MDRATWILLIATWHSIAVPFLCVIHAQQLPLLQIVARSQGRAGLIGRSVRGMRNASLAAWLETQLAANMCARAPKCTPQGCSPPAPPRGRPRSVRARGYGARFSTCFAVSARAYALAERRARSARARGYGARFSVGFKSARFRAFFLTPGTVAICRSRVLVMQAAAIQNAVPPSYSISQT